MATKEAAPVRTKTTYVIMQSQGAGDTWMEVGEAEGINDIEAIKNATAAIGVEDGTFLAIPTRSFRPREIQVKTHRHLTIR